MRYALVPDNLDSVPYKCQARLSFLSYHIDDSRERLHMDGCKEESRGLRSRIKHLSFPSPSFHLPHTKRSEQGQSVYRPRYLHVLEHDLVFGFWGLVMSVLVEAVDSRTTPFTFLVFLLFPFLPFLFLERTEKPLPLIRHLWIPSHHLHAAPKPNPPYPPAHQVSQQFRFSQHPHHATPHSCSPSPCRTVFPHPTRPREQDLPIENKPFDKMTFLLSNVCAVPLDVVFGAPFSLWRSESLDPETYICGRHLRHPIFEDSVCSHNTVHVRSLT